MEVFATNVMIGMMLLNVVILRSSPKSSVGIKLVVCLEHFSVENITNRKFGTANNAPM